jgi:hypothetical protein
MSALLMGQPVQAQNGVFGTFTNIFDGYLKNSTALRLKEMDEFTAIQNVLELKYSDWLTDNVGLTLVGRAVYDGVYDVEDGLNPKDEDDYHAYADPRKMEWMCEKLELPDPKISPEPLPEVIEA